MAPDFWSMALAQEDGGVGLAEMNSPVAR